MNTKTFLYWLPVAVIITIVFGTIYTVVQQDQRATANDPQVQLAEDTAAALSAGYPVSALVQSGPTIDMSKNLDPFFMVFDSSGSFLGSSAFNGSSSPTLPPAGIFAYVRAHGEDRVTWQTPDGLRFAAVALPWTSTATSTAPGVPTSGFIVVARSLREVEALESKTGLITFIGWAISILVSFGGAWVVSLKNRQIA